MFEISFKVGFVRQVSEGYFKLSVSDFNMHPCQQVDGVSVHDPTCE